MSSKSNFMHTGEDEDDDVQWFNVRLKAESWLEASLAKHTMPKLKPTGLRKMKNSWSPCSQSGGWKGRRTMEERCSTNVNKLAKLQQKLRNDNNTASNIGDPLPWVIPCPSSRKFNIKPPRSDESFTKWNNTNTQMRLCLSCMHITNTHSIMMTNDTHTPWSCTSIFLYLSWVL